MGDRKDGNKTGFREKFRYWFDNIMSKGTVSMVGILFLITLVVVVVAGVLAVIFDKSGGHSIGASIWVSLMHAIDAGTITGHSGSFIYMLLMTLVTICGLFITSVLIGIINTGMENKMASLRKGKSRVLSRDHTVILGTSPSTYTLLSELIEENSNGEKATVVIMDDSMEKEEMEDAIRQRIPDTGSTKIICRSGNISDLSDLEVCSPELARSIIINSSDDFVTIKTMLAVTNLLKKSNNTETYITAIISDAENYEAALIAGEDRAEVLFFDDTIARIAANTCRQPGLSSIYTEIFSFEGNEIYLERVEEAEGLKMSEINLHFPKSTVLGIQKQGHVMLNPPGDIWVQKGDKLVLLTECRGINHAESKAAEPDMSAVINTAHNSPEPKQKMLIIGYSPRIEKILDEEDKYMAEGSEIFIAIQDEYKNMLPKGRDDYKNIKVNYSFCNIYSKDVLRELLKWKPCSVFVSSSLQTDADTDDSKTLLVLLQLRAIAKEMNMKHSVTSEMRNAENQELAKITEVKDFVISSNITSLMLTQISQTRELRKIFRELLSEEGAEIYMRPASDYVQLGKDVSMYTASAAAVLKNQVFIGYSKLKEDGSLFDVIINPEKSSEQSFNEGDRFVVLSED